VTEKGLGFLTLIKLGTQEKRSCGEDEIAEKTGVSLFGVIESLQALQKQGVLKPV
jgi:predicted transcriptional regulator